MIFTCCLFCLLPLLEVFNVLIKFMLEKDVFIYDFLVTTLMYLDLMTNYQCDTITHLEFYDWFLKWILSFSTMFITIWSQKLLCNCNGYQDAMCYHGFVIIINMTTCLIFGQIIFEFRLIYLNDLKLGIQKYHLLLWLIVSNKDSIFNDDHVACHVSTIVLQLVINFIPHDINFSKIIDWSKVFIIPKHVFYDLSYATIMSNTILKTIKNVLTTNSLGWPNTS
jgi:hypothetical protein